MHQPPQREDGEHGQDGQQDIPRGRRRVDAERSAQRAGEDLDRRDRGLRRQWRHDPLGEQEVTQRHLIPLGDPDRLAHVVDVVWGVTGEKQRGDPDDRRHAERVRGWARAEIGVPGSAAVRAGADATQARRTSTIAPPAATRPQAAVTHQGSPKRRIPAVMAARLAAATTTITGYVGSAGGEAALSCPDPSVLGSTPFERARPP